MYHYFKIETPRGDFHFPMESSSVAKKYVDLFERRIWISQETPYMDDISQTLNSHFFMFLFHMRQQNKTMRIVWNPITDQFKYSTVESETPLPKSPPKPDVEEKPPTIKESMQRAGEKLNRIINEKLFDRFSTLDFNDDIPDVEMPVDSFINISRFETLDEIPPYKTVPNHWEIEESQLVTLRTMWHHFIYIHFHEEMDDVFDIMYRTYGKTTEFHVPYRFINYLPDRYRKSEDFQKFQIVCGSGIKLAKSIGFDFPVWHIMIDNNRYHGRFSNIEFNDLPETKLEPPVNEQRFHLLEVEEIKDEIVVEVSSFINIERFEKLELNETGEIDDNIEDIVNADRFENLEI